jgi:hypothetical protein
MKTIYATVVLSRSASAIPWSHSTVGCTIAGLRGARTILLQYWNTEKYVIVVITLIENIIIANSSSSAICTNACWLQSTASCQCLSTQRHHWQLIICIGGIFTNTHDPVPDSPIRSVLLWCTTSVYRSSSTSNGDPHHRVIRYRIRVTAVVCVVSFIVFSCRLDPCSLTYATRSNHIG